MPKKLEKITAFLIEINNEKPQTYADYFIFDVLAYMDIENTDLEMLTKRLGAKSPSLHACQTKEEVRNWLQDITAYIVMKIDIEPIVADYFTQKLSHAY